MLCLPLPTVEIKEPLIKGGDVREGGHTGQDVVCQHAWLSLVSSVTLMEAYVGSELDGFNN